LLVGTGKYKDFAETRAAIDARRHPGYSRSATHRSGLRCGS